MVQRALLDTRLAVRRALARSEAVTAAVVEHGDRQRSLPLVLVGLSGGSDSLALAAAAATEALRARVRAGAVIIDHGLQPASADVAVRAAEQARALGLDPVIVRQVTVGEATAAGGPEAVAREARYAAYADVAAETAACAILTGHTRDDQAEQMLLGLARGSGSRSLGGIPVERALAPGIVMLRPFLISPPEITREVTEAACAQAGLEAWHDPHNDDRAYARVRVRHTVLPMLERELGAGIATALARSADIAREDADALDALAGAIVADVLAAQPPATAADDVTDYDSVAIDVALLADQLPALRNRAIRVIATQRFAAHLSRDHVHDIVGLVTAWHGQGTIYVPRMRVSRIGSTLQFSSQQGSPRS